MDAVSSNKILRQRRNYLTRSCSKTKCSNRTHKNNRLGRLVSMRSSYRQGLNNVNKSNNHKNAQAAIGVILNNNITNAADPTRLTEVCLGEFTRSLKMVPLPQRQLPEHKLVPIRISQCSVSSGTMTLPAMTPSPWCRNLRKKPIEGTTRRIKRKRLFRILVGRSVIATSGSSLLWVSLSNRVEENNYQITERQSKKIIFLCLLKSIC